MQVIKNLKSSNVRSYERVDVGGCKVSSSDLYWLHAFQHSLAFKSTEFTMTSMSPPIKTQPYTWIVRFDVAPLWVADGFALDDGRALEMLGTDLSGACMSSEVAATVIVAPDPMRIAGEQGYDQAHPHVGGVVAELKSGTPNATLMQKALADAIQLLGSVAYVAHENDNTEAVLSQLRDAMALVNGASAISTIEWQPVEE